MATMWLQLNFADGVDTIRGKRKRRRLGKLQNLEVVAICDHLSILIDSELEQKIAWKALPVALDLPIGALGLHPVQLSQVHINNDPPAANQLDIIFDSRQKCRGACTNACCLFTFLAAFN